MIRDEHDRHASVRFLPSFQHASLSSVHPPPPPYKFSTVSSSKHDDDKKVSCHSSMMMAHRFDVKAKTGNGAASSSSCSLENSSKRVPLDNELHSRLSIDHRARNLRSDFFSSCTSSHQRVNVLRNNPEHSPQGSTFSSPRSSISTLASTNELRHLVYSPLSGCSCTPSPALVGCAECRRSSSASSGGRRSFVCASPADTVIIHHGSSGGSGDNTHVGHRGGPVAARYISNNTNTGLQQPQHQCCSASCSYPHQSIFNGPTVNPHQTTTPPLISVNKNNTHRPCSSVSSSSSAARKSSFSPAFVSHVAETPRSCCPAMNVGRTRDISAPVFSQTQVDDYEEPPPGYNENGKYKPPVPAVVTKLRLPTTVTTGRDNKGAEVEKKLEELTAQFASKSLVEEEEFDDEEYFGQCYLCGERVVGVENACQAMQNLYHTSCFICSICGRVLRGKAFYHVKGKIMCEEDYLYSGFQLSADKCGSCGHLIMDMILQALGKTYHPGCFRCCVCNKALDGVPFTLDVEGKIYCIEDYRDVFAPKCARCSLPITPVEDSGETVRVVSMERDFHVDCYACEDCALQLTDHPKERRCYPLDGHLLCVVCHNKRRDKRAYSQQSSTRSATPSSSSVTPCGINRESKIRSVGLPSSNHCSRS